MTEFVKKVKKISISKDTEIVKNLLPKHYACEDRENGVHCYSDKGIHDINEENYFDAFCYACKTIFGERFMEIYHQTCTHHKQFTVYLRK